VIPSARWAAAGVLGAGAAMVVLAGAYQPIEAPRAFGIAAALVAAAVAVAIIVLAVTRPWPGTLLFIAAMPVVSVARAQAWIGPVQVLPVTVLILALAAGVVLSRGAWPAAASAPSWRSWALVAAGAALALAATLAGGPTVDGLNITLHGLMEPMAVFAVIVAQRPSTDRAFQAMLAVAVSVIVATLINLAWLGAVLVPRDLYEQRLLLARLTYFNAGIFGLMLVSALPAAAAPLFLAHRFDRPRMAVISAWLAVGLMVGGLFFTYTKSAWLSAAVVSWLLILLLVPGWRRRIPMLIGVAILLAAVVPYPLPLLRSVAPGLANGYASFLATLQGTARLESWDPETYQGSGSVGIRLEAVGGALELAADSPLLGVGPGRFQAEFARIRPDAAVPDLQSAHDLLPNVAAEYGFPLALLIAGGLAWLVLSGLRGPPAATHDARVICTLLAVSLIGFVCMATLFGVDLYRTYRTMNADVVTAAVLAGLILVVAREPRPTVA